MLALRLAEGGARVTLLERAPTPGGLAGAFDFGGHRVDRFYHVIVPSDERMIALAEELGLADRLSFTPVGVGFFVDGTMYPFNGLGDFLRFPPLSPLGRARLAWFVLHCQLRRDFDALEQAAAGALAHAPLRAARRGAHLAPAARLPLQLQPRRAARDLPVGAHQPHALRPRGPLGRGDAWAACAAATNSSCSPPPLAPASSAWTSASAPASKGSLRDAGARVTGVRVDGADERFDLTIPTLQPPALRRLLPEDATAAARRLPRALPRRRLPDPQAAPLAAALLLGQYLRPHARSPRWSRPPTWSAPSTPTACASRTCPSTATRARPEFAEDDETVYRRYTEMLAKLVPDFSHEDVVDWTVQRAPLVEPVHALGHEPRCAPVWPGVDGLALASASQIYPRLLNGESVVGLAERVAGEALERTRGRAENAPARELVAHAAAA